MRESFKDNRGCSFGPKALVFELNFPRYGKNVTGFTGDNLRAIAGCVRLRRGSLQEYCSNTVASARTMSSAVLVE